MSSESLGSGDRDVGMLAFRVAYDGRRFRGFQRQPDVRTVEGTMFEGFATLGLGSDATTAPDGYAAAGRTDAGVSALAQTISLRGPSWVTPAALNAELPDTIRVWAAAPVTDDFHPRHDAVERTYEYFLPADGIDLSLARRVCATLEGTHDLHNLTTAGEDTVRTMTEIVLAPAGPFVRLQVRSPGFLREQVRRLATLVGAIGRGDVAPSFLGRVLSPDPLQGPDGLSPASAEPLVLADVRYPAISFSNDRETRATVRSVFAERRDRDAAMARVMGTIARGVAETR